MSRARFSILVYLIYLAIAGACVALVLAYKELQISRYEIVRTFQLNVYTRSFVATFLSVLVIMRIAASVFLLLAACDYAGALWTQLAIWSDRRKAQSTAG